jgi:hypothetical protein
MIDLAREAIFHHVKGVQDKQSLIRRWRALKLPGRLYWRNHTNWRDWDSKAFACYKEGTARTWYYTMDALKTDLLEMEAQAKPAAPGENET